MLNTPKPSYDPLMNALTSSGYTGKDAIRDTLEQAGYFDLPETCCGQIKEALAQGGEIVSRCTKGVLINKGDREAPASVGPDSVKVGDTVQLLNWKPLGVKGAKIDLFPKGKITKTYFRKCLVKCGDKEGVENRLEAVELDGKGPEDVILKGGQKLPYILKDSTILLRYPDMAQPSGKTDHTSYGVV